jgi:diacylglycerol kinase family enzyme
MATHLLVGNPTAQSGKNKQRIDHVLSLLASAGIDADLLPTLPAGATIGAVRDALDAGSYEVVIAMGGDGTFREVGAGLYSCRARERIALAMMPTGTANDQGKSFGLEATPEALEMNVAVIREGCETRLDAGIIRGGEDAASLFFDSAGWGLSARVLAQRNKDRALVETLGPLKEIYRDHAVYAGAFLKTFLESYVVDDKIAADAVIDGDRVELTGLTDLLAKNTRIYAGAWVFDRTSRHDDGMFELVPFRGKRDWASKAMVDLDGHPLTEDVWNQVGIEHSKPIRFSSLELTLTAPDGGAALAAQIDGEEWVASSNVRIDVDARALRLIVPARFQ